MKKVYLLFILVFFIFGCSLVSNSNRTEPVKDQEQVLYKPTLDDQLDDLTAQIILSLSQERKSKIAIIEFPDLDGNVSQFGRFLAEELITRLYLTGEFEVIERQLLNQVMAEHRLLLQGIIDESSARELGRILGVDAICSGSVADLVNSVKVNARLISAETGKIFSVASVEIPKNDVINKMLNDAVVSQKPAEKSQIETPDKADSPKGIIAEQEINDVLFQLNNCQLEDRKVTCDLTITVLRENDVELTIWLLKTVFYDQVGNDYHLTRLQLANSETRPNPEGEWGGGSRLGKKLISGIPTLLHIEFDNVSSQVESISLLEIDCRDFMVQFRDIEF